MDNPGSPSPSARLGKRKWLPDSQSGDPGPCDEPTVSWNDTHLSFDGSDAVARKKAKLATTAVPGPGNPLDTLMQDRCCLSNLPNEILQHIFSFVDPISLGRLMCLSRSFRSLLDPSTSLPQPSGQVKSLSLRRQDVIWAISRKHCFSGFPKPLDGMTELGMWKLILSRHCELCGKTSTSKPQGLAPAFWNAGPGRDGVRSIWPFGIRSCSGCLERKLVKDNELLISNSTASTLRSGLPFAIFSDSMDYIPAILLQQMATPPHLNLTKYYYLPQLEALQAKLKDVQLLGPAATEEWYKGLEATGRRLSGHAARLEQWELQGGPAKLITMLPVSTGLANPALRTLSAAKPEQRHQPALTDRALLSDNETISLGSFLYATVPSGAVDQSMDKTGVQEPTLLRFEDARFDARQHRDQPVASIPSQIGHRSKPGRTLQEVEDTKIGRRKEIERRCQSLVPPILPATLAFMDAFQASIQISLPMDDNQWEILKPRLLSQRPDALHKQQAYTQSLRDPAVQLEERTAFEEEQRVARENIDHMWSELKIPSRDKIARYARAFIQSTWSNGHGVSKSTSSKFAAEVLCHVRQQFELGITQEDQMLALKGTAFPQDTQSQALRRLRLEDMKWAFEEFVKPHTEKFGKELFLCSVCDTNQKLFSFEAVIQHYAAKHTSSFSHGNAVVYWKAEWPLEPPFDPSPNIPWVHDGSQPIAHMRMQSQYAPRTRTTPTVPASTSTGSYQMRVNELAGFILDASTMTDGISGLHEASRISVVIQIACSKFAQRFKEEVGLHQFLSCVQNTTDLRSLWEVNGLQCKACSTYAGSPLIYPDGWAEVSRSFGELMTHFQRTHIDFDASSHTDYGVHSSASKASTSSMRLDWRCDMLLLPPGTDLRSILHSSLNHMRKVQSILDALNEDGAAYAPSKPAGPPSHISVSDRPYSELMPQDARRGERLRSSSHHGSVRGIRTGRSFAPSEASIPASEDEYDPRRPAPRPFPGPGAGTSQRSISPGRPQQHAVGHSNLQDGSDHREYPFRNPGLENRWGPDSQDRLAFDESTECRRYEPAWIAHRGSGLVHNDRPDESPRSAHSRPGSKAMSRHSLSGSATAEAFDLMRSMPGQIASVSGPSMNTAASNFLSTFDPTLVDAQPDVGGTPLGGSRISQGAGSIRLSRHRNASRSEDQLHHLAHTSRDLRGSDAYDVQEHAPPLLTQEYTQARANGADIQAHFHREVQAPRRVEYISSRESTDRDHMDSIASRYPGPREVFDMTRVHQGDRGYHGHRYEQRVFYEDRQNFSEPRYAVLAQRPVEVYRERIDDHAASFLEVRKAYEASPMEEREYLNRPHGVTRYVPMDFSPNAEVVDAAYPQSLRGRTPDFTQHDDAQFAREPPLEMGQPVRTFRRDYRYHGYGPVEEEPRYVAR